MKSILEASKIVGHINGESLEKITFVADQRKRDGSMQRITLGEMYVAVDRYTHERFLLRVSTTRYGQHSAFRTESARAYNQVISTTFENEHLNFNEIYQDDRPEQRFIEAECEYVGYIDLDGKFGPPKHLPSDDSPVRKLDEGDLDFMENFLGDVPFGKLRSGSNVLSVPVGLFVELIPYHMGVFAKTGGGKSNFVQRLLAGFLDLPGRAGILLLEPHGEYKQNLIAHPNAAGNLEVFEMKEGAPRRLRISYSDLSVTDLMNIKKQVNWTEPQERFMRDAEEKLGKDWFRFIVETPVKWDDAMNTDGTIQNGVTTVLKEHFPGTFEDTMQVAKSKLSRIKNAPFLTRDPNVSDIKEIMKMLDDGKIVLIDLVGLESAQELLVSTILASKALKRRKHIYNTDRTKCEGLPPIGILLEEAQRVLNKDANHDGNTFANICNEGRKFRVGLMPVTQQPKNIDANLMSQISTLFILLITDENDFEALKKVSAKPIDKLRQEIKGLQPGEAIISSPKSPFALPVKVDLYDDYIRELKKKKIHSTKTVKKPSFGLMM
ncbi:ATP-binding protein [Bacillus thuringiensis]|uniref:ATP-binding protein n=1 Tax=Bacillus thuringiensis TaxID=1428 RepID=UPI0021D65B27|nr:ATP-binding protein [Bacillus thuringiensis]MCU7666923.1 ATP-binding protein [Bacillus thuringiensis]